VYDVVVKKFTFAISSLDEFLVRYATNDVFLLMSVTERRTKGQLANAALNTLQLRVQK